mmetsp:Transcript_69595/g.201705  ORF Transcript_69595/g.201705 Transcript_69595/m.201705 type:complete len:294 (+) Transcript_69595:544-1425(+)
MFDARPEDVQLPAQLPQLPILLRHLGLVLLEKPRLDPLPHIGGAPLRPRRSYERAGGRASEEVQTAWCDRRRLGGRGCLQGLLVAEFRSRYQFRLQSRTGRYRVAPRTVGACRMAVSTTAPPPEMPMGLVDRLQLFHMCPELVSLAFRGLQPLVQVRVRALRLRQARPCVVELALHLCDLALMLALRLRKLAHRLDHNLAVQFRDLDPLDKLLDPPLVVSVRISHNSIALFALRVRGRHDAAAPRRGQRPGPPSAAPLPTHRLELGKGAVHCFGGRQAHEIRGQGAHVLGARL